MSHPIPGHDYSEEHKHETHKEYGVRRHKALHSLRHPQKTIKDLKQMISEPASKEWFAKHGTPKSKHLAKAKALEKKKRGREEYEADKKRGNGGWGSSPTGPNDQSN